MKTLKKLMYCGLAFAFLLSSNLQISAQTVSTHAHEVGTRAVTCCSGAKMTTSKTKCSCSAPVTVYTCSKCKSKTYVHDYYLSNPSNACKY